MGRTFVGRAVVSLCYAGPGRPTCISISRPLKLPEPEVRRVALKSSIHTRLPHVRRKPHRRSTFISSSPFRFLFQLRGAQVGSDDLALGLTVDVNYFYRIKIQIELG